MMRKIALTLLIFLTAIPSIAYASSEDISNIIQVACETVAEENKTFSKSTSIDYKEVNDSAGILPNSIFYKIELGIEEFQISITASEEELAMLKARYATERASEAVVMTNEGREELASEGIVNFINLLISSTKNMKNAVKSKEEKVQNLEKLNEAYEKNEVLLKNIFENVPEDSKLTIEIALNEHDKAIATVNGVYAAKEAFFMVKQQLEESKNELVEAKKSGDEALITNSKDKVKAAETLKKEIERLKADENSSKESMKNLIEQAKKGIEVGNKKLQDAVDKMEKAEKNTNVKAEKYSQKVKELRTK
jgi:hypothetical protein